LESDRAFKVAVLGSAVASADSPAAEKAFAIGELVVSRGGILLTGGCTGLPHAAVRGAIAFGGVTVAVSPATNREEHGQVYSYPLDSRIMIFTGMGTKGRNVILIRSSDACVFIGGGMGTLNEFTIAFDEMGPRQAIGILAGTGGLSREFPRLGSLAGGSSRALIVEHSDPAELVGSLFNHLHGA
jgi:uncharacterized protein (TIGR00725 family)